MMHASFVTQPHSLDYATVLMLIVIGSRIDSLERIESSNQSIVSIFALFLGSRRNEKNDKLHLQLQTIDRSTMGILWTAAACLAGLLVIALVTLLLVPIILAQITVWRYAFQRQSQKQQQTRKSWNEFRSALHVGTVWHTRHLPVQHAFRYPLFLFCLDLQEVQDGLFANTLWPLSTIVSFRESDHLKNGEGLQQQQGTGKDTAPAKAKDNDNDNTLQARICRLVAAKTRDKFQPTPATHRIILVTHLCYYGYCFNPVSFYYLQERQTETRAVAAPPRTVAVVAEVSNTPWLEMHCYVLHPDSVDMLAVVAKTQAKDDSSSMNYVFRKTFHVSPFMEMNYNYDWTFSPLETTVPVTTTTPAAAAAVPLRITTAMKTVPKTDADSSRLQFSATMNVHRRGLHPMTQIAWQIISYPAYCLILQIWIHYQAAWIFAKGVTYQPHPNEMADTTASRIIGTIMTPVFLLQDWLQQSKQPPVKERDTKKQV